MYNMLVSVVLILFLSFSCLIINGQSTTITSMEATAKELISNSRKDAGFCVHIGVSDGELTSYLGKNNRLLVHGLTNDEKLLESARIKIQNLKLYGRISVEKNDLKSLPYANQLVNLLIISNAKTLIDQGLKLEEIIRVLAPSGVACFENYTPVTSNEYVITQTLNGWTYITKNIPIGASEWTHTNVNTSGNRVSQDLLAEPPERIRWIAGVEWVMPDYSAEAMVVGGGRIYYIINESPIRKVFWPYLSVRDAFSGVLLWKKPGATTSLTMIAHGDLFFMSQNEKMIAVEGATGKEIKIYTETTKPNWAAIWENNLLVSCGDKYELRCLDLTSGELKWKIKNRSFEPASSLLNAAIHEGKLYYKERRKPSIGCIDLSNGTEIWNRDITADLKDEEKATLTSFYNGVMILATNKGICAFSSIDGKYLWQRTHVLLGTPTRRKAKSYLDGFFIKGLYWTHVGDIDENQPENRKYSVGRKFSWQGLDPISGEVKKKFDYPENLYIGASCFKDQATERWFMGGYSNFMNTETGTYQTRAEGLHTSCHIGVRVAYGLIYNSALYMPGRFIQGDMAVEGGTTESTKPPSDPSRFEKGPSYETFTQQTQKQTNDKAADWPTFRNNGLRNAKSTQSLPLELSELWSVTIGNKVSAPTVADGRVFVASIEEHKVLAYNSKTGALLWSFLADSRIKAPPSIDNGLCVFGCNDGNVYALEANSGKLVWRFQAARTTRKIVARERVESTWPIEESVVLQNNFVCFVSGRHGEVDGGNDLYVLEASTGKFLWHKKYEGEYPPLLTIDNNSLSLNSKMFFDLKTGEKGKRLFLADSAYESRIIDPSYRIGKSANLPIQVRSLLVSKDSILVAGRLNIGHVGDVNIVWASGIKNYENTPDVHPLDSKTTPPTDYKLWAFSHSDGKKIAELTLSARPNWDSLALAEGNIYLTTEDGKLHCIGKK